MQYVNRAFLTVNDREVADFKQVAELDRELATPVALMHTTGYAKRTERFRIEVNYVVPTGPEFDWASITEGTLVIEMDGGRRVLYTGVTTLSVGRRDYDEERELVQTITLMATKRTEQ